MVFRTCDPLPRSGGCRRVGACRLVRLALLLSREGAWCHCGTHFGSCVEYAHADGLIQDVLGVDTYTIPNVERKCVLVGPALSRITSAYMVLPEFRAAAATGPTFREFYNITYTHVAGAVDALRFKLLIIGFPFRWIDGRPKPPGDLLAASARLAAPAPCTWMTIDLACLVVPEHKRQSVHWTPRAWACDLVGRHVGAIGDAERAVTEGVGGCGLRWTIRRDHAHVRADVSSRVTELMRIANVGHGVFDQAIPHPRWDRARVSVGTEADNFTRA